ncbi:MAG: hypothetical protein IJR35_04345, partial [Synergistaceae bacterium]|nr:hypothetical protein [Synergistaceae bacterium]
LNVKITQGAGLEIAKRSRGTPRVALRLLRRVRDVAQVRSMQEEADSKSEVDEFIAVRAMNMLDIDSEGLDEGDRKILRTIIDLFNGGPVGLGTIAAALNEDSQTIEDIYEPYLIQKGLIERTPRGRKATPNAYIYLGRDYGDYEGKKI